MATLSLGVLDVAYSDPDAKGAVTTGEVAEFLEKQYHVMEVFFELKKQKIADELAQSTAERIESLLQGASVSSPTIDVEGVNQMFRQYLDADEWQQVSGKMILAAKLGISHRKKDKKRAGSRPAFIDTGLYQQSFRSWIKP